LESAGQGIEVGLNDDFNTPEVLARIFEVVRAFNQSYTRGQKITEKVKARALAFSAWLRDHGALMALFQKEPKAFLGVLDDMLLKQMSLLRSDIDSLVNLRIEARKNKNFAESDRLRDELSQKGISVHDTPTGTFWEVKK